MRLTRVHQGWAFVVGSAPVLVDGRRYFTYRYQAIEAARVARLSVDREGNAMLGSTSTTTGDRHYGQRTER